MGGDEFLVVLEDVSEEKDVTLYAERLVAEICEPVHLGRETLRVGVSVGVAISSEAGDEPEALTRAAAIAMFSAKGDGGSRVRPYHPSMATDRAAAARRPSSR